MAVAVRFSAARLRVSANPLAKLYLRYRYRYKSFESDKKAATD